MSDFPTVPGYRLAPAAFTEFEWLGVSCFMVVWNFVYLVILGLFLTAPQDITPGGGVAIGFLGAVGFVGAGFVLHRAGQVIAAGVTMVAVEVGEQPFVPGASYPLRIVETGLYRLTHVRVELVCEKVTTHPAGAPPHAARRAVLSRTRAGRSGSLWREFAVAVPADAVRSFKETDHEIAWTLRLSGRVLRVLPYRQSFQVVVRPRPRSSSARRPVMFDKPAVRVELAGERFHPGDEVSGAFVLTGGPPDDAESVELSVLWRTSGKGTEDLGVAFYQGWRADDGTLADLPNPGTFAVRLPNTPWTYDGTLVKIGWLARVRVRFGATGEVVAEAPFVLAPRSRP